jgi:hypothetical protein
MVPYRDLYSDVIYVYETGHRDSICMRLVLYKTQSAQIDTFLLTRYRSIKKVSNTRTMPCYGCADWELILIQELI